jgi:hypothetical protein
LRLVIYPPPATGLARNRPEPIDDSGKSGQSKTLAFANFVSCGATRFSAIFGVFEPLIACIARHRRLRHTAASAEAPA